MNITSKEFAAPLHFTIPALFGTRPKIGTWILTCLVMLSGFGVVYMSDINRRMVTTLESTHAHRIYLETEWDKLLLERSTWSSQSRIQEIATTSLAMTAPDPKTMTTIQIRS